MLQPKRCVLEDVEEKSFHNRSATRNTCRKSASSTCKKCRQHCCNDYVDDWFTDDDQALFFGTEKEESCEPETISDHPNCTGQVLAMAYVKNQSFDVRKLHKPSAALDNGTLFTELTKPFRGGKCND